MKIRILSALVGVVVLIGVLVCPYTIVLAGFAAVLAALAVWELLRNTDKVKSLAMVIVSMLFSASSVMMMYFTCIKLAEHYYPSIHHFDAEMKQWMMIMLALPLVYGLLMVVVWLFCMKKVTFNAVCYGYLFTLYPTIGFGSMVMLRETPNQGMWLLVLLLMIAWISDTGAYFVGTFLGKHKMAPVISPKKSWEGFFGGWVISVLFAVALFIVRHHIVSGEGIFYTLTIFLPVVIILAPLSVCGDLLASVIKRRCGIKDFGKIMPGHGGVMDRFDSVVFIAPILFLVTQFLSYSLIN